MDPPKLITSLLQLLPVLISSQNPPIARFFHNQLYKKTQIHFITFKFKSKPFLQSPEKKKPCQQKKLLCFLLFCLVNTIIISQAQSKTACTPSSCGDLTGITFPFRLKTDPKTCGNPKYELECANNRASVTFKGKKLNVLAINYPNYSIRLIDPGLENNYNCSFPSHTLTYGDFPSQEYNREWEYNVPVTFITCSKKPVTAAATFPMVDNSFCRNDSAFGYVALLEPEEKEKPRSPLPESCRVESSTRASIFGPNQDNSSLSGIHRMLEYGFEVSFYRAFCQKCESTYGSCGLDEANNYDITCVNHCSEDFPLSKLPFRCQFQFYAAFGGLSSLMGLGGLLILRFLIGIPCLLVLIVCMCRKRHLPADQTVEMKNAYVASSSATFAQV